jgi:hypothetical protein
MPGGQSLPMQGDFIPDSLTRNWCMFGARHVGRSANRAVMTYAANLGSSEPLITAPSIQFVKSDVGNAGPTAVRRASLDARRPPCRRIPFGPVHCRSQGVPGNQHARHLHRAQDVARRMASREHDRSGGFLHVSTDEGCSSLGPQIPFSRSLRHIGPTSLIPPARRRANIWYALSPRVTMPARLASWTIAAHISIPKSSFRQ